MNVDVGIPKIIHQTWKNETVPQHWSSSPINWKKYHLDYQYYLWTDEMNSNFILDKFPWFYNTYKNFRYPIQRADAVRYALLYVYGGIYSDLDIEPTSNLNDLFTYSGVYLVYSKNDLGANTSTNAFMASSPNENFWLECLTEMMKPIPWWCVGKHMKVMFSTGPQMVQRILNRYPKTIHLLPRTVLIPCGVCQPLPCTNEFSRLRILPGSSWISWDTKIYLFFMCNFKNIILFLLLLLIFYIYFKKHVNTKFKYTHKK